MIIQSTNEKAVTVCGQFKVWSDDEGREIEVKSKTVSWDALRAAAKQEDKDLAAAYTEILLHAERMESKRLVSEDWKRYGYPLRTGFGRQYQGQIVVKAWEIRRKQDPRKEVPENDVRIAYVLAWDRSVNRIEIRATSPDLPDVDHCYAWLTENYGGWHDELGGERTASTWFVA